MFKITQLSKINIMQTESISFTINGNAYTLKVGDINAAAKIPKADRQELIKLLATVKACEAKAQLSAQQSAKVTRPVPHTPITDEQTARPERLGRGDSDDLMARLILEEQRKQKPALTQKDIYKWVGIIAVAIIVLILIF